MRDEGERFGLDPRHASEISRLAWLGQLTDRQAEAAHRIAAAYSSLQRLKGWPSPNPGAAGIWRQVKVDVDQDTPTDGTRDPTDDPDERVRRAQARWHRIQDAIDVLPSAAATRRIRGLIERLCVLGQSLTSAETSELAPMLDYIAETMHIPGPPAAKPTGQSSPTERRRPSQPRPRRANLAEVAFREIIRQLRPDLSEPEITAKWYEQQARIDRERIRGPSRRR